MSDKLKNVGRGDVVERCRELGLIVEELSKSYIGVRCPPGYQIAYTGSGYWQRAPQAPIPLQDYYRDLLEDLEGGIEPKPADVSEAKQEKPLGRLERMSNKAMARKLAAGECLDLSPLARTDDGDYIVPESWVGIIEDRDLCNANDETWIWSVGRRRADGVVLASHSSKLYQNPSYECLWLR